VFANSNRNTKRCSVYASEASEGEPDTSATRHFGITKLVPKFKTNHGRAESHASELSSVEVSGLFVDHGTRVEVSCTTFLVSKCLEIGAEVSQSVWWPKCPVTGVGFANSNGNTKRSSVYATEASEAFVGQNMIAIVALERQHWNAAMLK